METIFKTTRYRIEIYKREKMTKYPDKPYLAMHIKEKSNGAYINDKVLYKYVYSSLKEAMDKSQSYIDILENKDKQIEEERFKNKEKFENKKINKKRKAKQFYRVKNIIVNIWVDDYTHVEFYKVVEVKERSIIVKALENQIAKGSLHPLGNSGMACMVRPSTRFKEDAKETLIRVYDRGRLSNSKPFYFFHKWDGKPKYYSYPNQKQTL